MRKRVRKEPSAPNECATLVTKYVPLKSAPMSSTVHCAPGTRVGVPVVSPWPTTAESINRRLIDSAMPSASACEITVVDHETARPGTRFPRSLVATGNECSGRGLCSARPTMLRPWTASQPYTVTSFALSIGENRTLNDSRSVLGDSVATFCARAPVWNTRFSSTTNHAAPIRCAICWMKSKSDDACTTCGYMVSESLPSVSSCRLRP